MEVLSAALVGCGRRSRNVFSLLLKEMKQYVKLIAVCDINEKAAAGLGAIEKVPFYTSLDELIEKAKPDFAIVATNRNNHTEPAVKLLNSGIHVLIETPIAETLSDADEIINAAERNNLKVEIAENYYRFPKQQIIQKLIKADIFGKPHVVYSNFMGHGYHGLSLIRSYIGFSIKPVRATGFTSTYNVVNHIWRKNEPPAGRENWQHGIIEYENSAVGIYNFSSLTYGSPLRREQEKNNISFYAEKGMGTGFDLVVLEGSDARMNIQIDRKIAARYGGMAVLDSYVARTSPEIAWVNPLAGCNIAENKLGEALCIWELIQAIKENKSPDYGPKNARIDRATELALEKSWSNENKPVML